MSVLPNCRRQLPTPIMKVIPPAVGAVVPVTPEYTITYSERGTEINVYRGRPHFRLPEAAHTIYQSTYILVHNDASYIEDTLPDDQMFFRDEYFHRITVSARGVTYRYQSDGGYLWYVTTGTFPED
jgi:hypothetical protein